MTPEAEGTVKKLSLFLGISIFTFGVLKFIDPFHGWFATQISKSGLPPPAFALGIASEIGVGLALMAPWALTAPLSARRRDLLALASAGLVGVMGVATFVHLHPDVPAEVLPLKLKPPVIPLTFLALAAFNLVKVLRR